MWVLWYQHANQHRRKGFPALGWFHACQGYSKISFDISC
jgi:hypothetical protein